MRRVTNCVVRLGLVGGVVTALLASARAADLPRGTGNGSDSSVSASAEPVPVEKLPPACREKARALLEQPTLHSRGPVEVFRGKPAFYHWLMDHPDKAVIVWRRLGARCTEITDRGQGRFGYTDKHGSDLAWDTVFESPTQRIWYAEGVATPGPLLPVAPVRALVVMRHLETLDPLGRPLIHHQAELFMQTDSKALALMARLVGGSAPQLAEQCVGQMELFFSALVWYLDRHPERADALLLTALPPGAPATAQVRQILAQPTYRANSSSYNAAIGQRPTGGPR